MNKKIYLLLTVLLALSFNLKAQTAKIEQATATPGTTASFDITLAGMPTNLGAVSLFIAYDPNVLTFTGSTLVDPQFSGYFINDMTATHQVGIQWTNPLGADINGIILSLEFQYNLLGGSCDLTFGPGCEFTDKLLNSIPVIYTNGSIGPGSGYATVTIDEVGSNAGPVSLGVKGAGFASNVAAVTLFIDFDPARMQFTGYSSTLPFVTISGNNTSGRVSVVWSSIAGASLNTTFLTLNFNYDGTGVSELVFKAGCEITNVNLTYPPVSYDNGKVWPLSTIHKLKIEDEINAVPGTVNVDINATGFPLTVGAITLNIGFNPAHLTFLNITGGTVGGASASLMGPGLLKIVWTNFNGQGIDGKVLTMNFNYHFGSSEITFEGGCEIVTKSLVLIPVEYIKGSISPLVGGAEVSLPVKSGTVGQQINFPIRAKNFIMNVSAISMFIGYNKTVLTYSGHTAGTLPAGSYFINNMSSTSQIGIQWVNTGVFDIDPNGDDTLLTMHFIYNGGESDLTFDAGCEFAKNDLTTIPVSFFDGAVITGTLFNIKAFLEGPYNGTTMNTLLLDQDLIPTEQPYDGETWYYNGTESVTDVPANVVDWVLLEIRETAGAASTATAATIVAKKAAFILNNGNIVGLDGSSNVLIPAVFTKNVYVVVYHRNHIRVMSANALTMAGGAYVYDFTNAKAKAYDSQQKEIATGIFGMYAGDVYNDGEVFGGDIDPFLNAYPSFNVYNAGDVNLDGEVFGGDIDPFLNNYPTFTTIP